MHWTHELDAGWRRVRAWLQPRPVFAFLGEYAVARTWRGDRIFLPAGDLGISPYIVTSGRWEPRLERLLGRLLRRGQVVVEAGANVGYHTLAMGHAVGPTGRVHAFEANPAVATLLARTVELAGFNDRVVAANQAVSDQAGTVQLLVDPQRAASGHLAWGQAAPHYSRSFDVPAVRLDDVLAELPRMDLLRMDIEGSEGLALRGAQALVRRSPTLRIVMEWDPLQMAVRTDVAELARWLAAEGFHAWALHGRGLRPVEMAVLPQLTLNSLLLRRGS